MTTTTLALNYEYGTKLPSNELVDGLSSDLEQVLTRYPELRTIGCEFKNGKLILHGKVSSFYLKQLCQEALRSVAEELLATIDNRLQVSEF